VGHKSSECPAWINEVEGHEGPDKDEEDEVGGVFMVCGVEENGNGKTVDDGRVPSPPISTFSRTRNLRTRRFCQYGAWAGEARCDDEGCGCGENERGHEGMMVKNVVVDGTKGLAYDAKTKKDHETKGKRMERNKVKKEVERFNRFELLRTEDEEDDEDTQEWMVGAVEEVNEIIEVTIDSGAAKSVWPLKKKGVTRTKTGKNYKLAAANGSVIRVEGEARLDFQRAGTSCCMKFLDADVKKPLAAVSAMVDEGNKVVFSPDGSFVECLRTGERIELARKKGVFVLALDTGKEVTVKQRRGGKAAMGIGEVRDGSAEEEREDKIAFMSRWEPESLGVFRRQAA
jgi:hypothetical protein